MPTPRCADPDCPCRSPELQWFTNQVLRRDANKTDYIIIPLVAGVMARSLLADDTRRKDDPEDAPLLAQASAVVELAERGRTEPWDGDTHAYGIVADLLFCNWPAVMTWGSISYERTILGVPFAVGDDEHLAAVVRFLSAQPPPSLTESTIVAVIGSFKSAEGSKAPLPLLTKAGRRLRVVLADRLRREGLVTWSKVLAAAVDDWSIPTLERLARHNAEAGDASIRYMIAVTDEAKKEAAAEEPPSLKLVRDDPPPNEASEPSDAETAEQLVQDAVAEITYWRGQRDVVQHERDTFAQRDARSRSRLESLERQLAAERVRRQELERELDELREERDRYAERVAAEEAVLEDAPTPATDTFSGKRVLFFTGVESADTRAAVAQGFWDLGAAQVDTYWTDKTRGPDVFPPDAIIAMDVSLMAHSTWNAILDKAKGAGAWYYWGKHGATTMARATAAAWSEKQQRG